MAPIRKGDGTALVPNGIKEVRKGDGTVLYSAIPDSALYHYPILERSTSTIVEELESEDATANNGITNVSGEWYGGYAESADGVDDYIAFPAAVAAWLETTQDMWLAFTVDADPSNYSGRRQIFGFSDNTPSVSQFWQVNDDDGSGTIGWDINGDDDNNIQISTDSTYLDGSKHRVIIQRTGITAADLEIWVDGSQAATSIISSGSFNGSFTNADTIPWACAVNRDGNIFEPIQTAIDNIIFGQLGTTLSSAEIQTDYDKQPWS